MSPPEGLQLDLATACLRMQQIFDELGNDVYKIGDIGARIFTCDLPRLKQHISNDTMAWLEEHVGLPKGWHD